MNLAKWLIISAKLNGADVAKFQVYDVDNILSKDFEWYVSLKHTQLTKENVKYLKNVCDEVGIEFLASVFDTIRVDWLEEIGVKRYKIASRSIYNKDLIDAIMKTGKDMIISLGMWNEDEFPKIHLNALYQDINYLYCISKYPTNPKDIDWEELSSAKYTGFSDHTIGLESAKKAIDLGVRIIEKHFTFDRNLPGPDHKGSMTPDELYRLVEYSKHK